MLKTIRLILLQRKARRLVASVYAAMDSGSYNCGNRMKIAMNPGIMRAARKADEVLEKIAKLDPSAPKSRITPVIEEMAR